MNALYLAAANLRFHWARTLVLVVAAALVLSVPVLTRTLLAQGEAQLGARAEATPLLLGTRGSRLDLVMAGAYFTDDLPEPTNMAASEAVWDSGLGIPVPLHTRFTAGGARVVGTTLDYFDLRALEVAQGRPFALLGEAVLGAGAAARLGAGPGDAILSDPENLFDLDGAYPLEMTVVGVLAPTGTPDDDAVFVDIKTAWVIAGIGHGHDDILAEGEDAAAAAARAVQYARITPENIDSFHFHGDPATYPVTAVMVAPYDDRSATILRGRYLDAEGPVQAVVPADVIEALVARLLRIAALVDAVTLVVGIAAGLALGLALFLSWRLRAPEMRTAFALGAGRGTIARMALAEVALVIAGAALLALPLVIVLLSQAPTIAARLIALGS
ncbi:ABC transporter permease [Jannaschia seohaensis]|uniref:Putative ABC transport system permease protein n=1 Tax=Jannaschia seohaensis TaxID=475081 RepID=A0A2Y9C832_9RHOB|nr:ABC transporter permease [Jannaschia seohaensis]PWJ17540.1 putative ABC transport system permease protein [Jannaschia seohaensis]SSA47683.1 putative ABC transport system permease protein [Jannaschia seohaensis]